MNKPAVVPFPGRGQGRGWPGPSWASILACNRHATNASVLNNPNVSSTKNSGGMLSTTPSWSTWCIGLIGGALKEVEKEEARAHSSFTPHQNHSQVRTSRSVYDDTESYAQKRRGSTVFSIVVDDTPPENEKNTSAIRFKQYGGFTSFQAPVGI
jgi:hypothetical protein